MQRPCALKEIGKNHGPKKVNVVGEENKKEPERK